MLAAIFAAVVFTSDGLGEGLYAVRHGFRARRAALGYAVAAIMAAVTRVVTPVNFTAESVAVATRTTKAGPRFSGSWSCRPSPRSSLAPRGSTSR